MLKWLTNLHRSELNCCCNADWLRNKISGDPKATEKFSAWQLSQRDIVGIYFEVHSGDITSESGDGHAS